MNIFKRKLNIKVHYHKANGSKTKHVEVKAMPGKTNSYIIYLNPIESIRVDITK